MNSDVVAQAREIEALRLALRELHQFVIDYLDGDPAPAWDYMVSPVAMDAARRSGCVIPNKQRAA